MTAILTTLLGLASFGFFPCQSSPRAETSPAEDEVGDSEVSQAIEQAITLLTENQENYESDPSVGTLPEDELDAWQEKEKNRLQKIRSESSDPREWPYEGVYRVGRSRHIPAGYRVGGTAICCDALMSDPSFSKNKTSQEAVVRGIKFLIETLEENDEMSPGPKRGYDVRGWGHAYALGAITNALHRGTLKEEALRDAAKKMIPHLMNCLEVNETKAGGWNYASDQPSSFMTASTLLTLQEVKKRGFEVDDSMIERGIAALERSRAETGAFGYSGKRTEPMPASSARSAAAELALYLSDKSDQERLKEAIDGFFDNWDELLKRKSQQGTHKPPYSIAPYYFFFGHTYAAYAIEHLTKDARHEYRQRLRKVLWRTREENGGWNDRVFPRTESYSTAMVILALTAPLTEPL